MNCVAVCVQCVWVGGGYPIAVTAFPDVLWFTVWVNKVKWTSVPLELILKRRSQKRDMSYAISKLHIWTQVCDVMPQ